jgi:hypothetical protein
MPTRSNACSELVRFWLQSRHGHLIDEAIPVPVPYALSDIDLVAYHPRGESIRLPGGSAVGPRLIVETKDEHDWDSSGREFGKALRADVQKLAEATSIPRGAKGVYFSMLRQEHFERATAIFGTDDFDRVFALHAVDQPTRRELAPVLARRRIYIVTIPEVVRDLLEWYVAHQRPAGLRQTLVGDLIHLLVGFCGLRLSEQVK